MFWGAFSLPNSTVLEVTCIWVCTNSFSLQRYNPEHFLLRKHFLVNVLLEEFQIALHLFSVIATLQKLATAPPWNHLCAAMWTTGNQVVGQTVTFYLVQQLIHLLLIGINLVCTGMLALPVAKIALNASDLLGREGAEKPTDFRLFA